MKTFKQFFVESEHLLDQWDNDEPKKFAQHLTKKFGPPDESTNQRVVWYNKDGFKRIEVKDEYTLHCCPAPHYDFVYSTIDLHVPKEFVKVLAESSESILLDLLKNEVSARCATLSANAVTLNYVLDVVSGRVQGSKEEYEKRIKLLYKNKLDPDPEWWPDSTKEVRKDNVSENFMDGRNPQDKGDMARHGLKNKTIAQLKKVRGSDSASPRKKQLAHFYINMHSEDVVSEDLRKWFSKTHPEGGWKRINTKGEPIGPCAREPGEPKPKCMSNEKIARLSKKQRASAVASKRKHDSDPDRQGKPINVSNFGKGKLSEKMENLEEKNVPTSPEKWAQAKAQAKSKFAVYPSAYANGWAAKKYKAMGGGWKSVSEAKDPREYDYEGDMAKSQLRSIIANAQTVHDMLKDDTNMAEWVQSKITLSADYISTVRDYMTSEMSEQVKPIEELKSSTLTSYIDKVATGPSRGKTQSGLLKSIKAITGVTKAIRKRSENNMKEEELKEISLGMVHNYMVAAHKKFASSSDEKKAKLIKGIKQASKRREPKPRPAEVNKDDGSPGGYYAGKKPGEYTGD
jgi:hypothetical protein